MISGIAAGADRNVIIGFKKTVGPSEGDFIRGHGGEVKKEFHIISAISAKVPEENIEKMKKDLRVKYDSIFKVADEYTASWGVQHINSQFVHDQWQHLIYSTNFNDANGDGLYNNIDVRLLLHNAKDLGHLGIAGAASVSVQQ